jgi:PAS domain S-box-containing protein
MVLPHGYLLDSDVQDMSDKSPSALFSDIEAATADSALYREILDSAVDTAVIGTDTRGRIIIWSAGAQHITGWTAGEMLGQPLDTFFTPEDRAAGRPAMEMRAADQSGRAKDMRWHLRKDGGRFYAHGSISPLKPPLKGYVKSFRDATVQHQTETALKEAQERMEFTLTSAQIVGTWDWDLLKNQVSADSRFARIHSVDPLIASSGAPLADFVRGIHAEDRDRVLAELNHSIAAGTPFESEYRLTRPDLASHYVLARGQCIFDATGAAVRFSGVTVDVTERKTTELALQLSEERYRSLFNSMESAFCIIDMVYDSNRCAVDYRFVEVNPAFSTNTGLRGVAGRTVKELVPTIEPYWIEIYAEVAATGKAKQFENHAQALDERWYDVVAFRIGDPTLSRVAILFNDITEKKRAEFELRLSEARLANALSIAALGTFEWFPRKDVFQLSARGREIFGFEPDDESASLSARARIHPEDNVRVRAEAFALLDSGSRRITEYRVILPDGAVRFVKSVSDALKDDDPMRERFVGVVEDVTERRLAMHRMNHLNEILEQRVLERTRELEQSQTRFQAYFNASPEYLYLLRLTDDDKLLFEDVNPAGAELYGLSRVAMVGRSPMDIAATEAGKEAGRDIERNSRRSLELGQTLRYEVDRQYGSRPRVTINTIISPVEKTPDHRGLVLVCKRDLTEQRQAEEALRQSQKMEAIGQLTGGIAHEFNNLLAAVMGSLEMTHKRIKQGRGNEVDRYIQAAQDSSKRAAALTQRLLAFSRRQTLSPVQTDVNCLIQSMEDLIRRTIGPSIELSVAATDNPWMTQVDQNQLENALLNLCLNSRDAMPTGGRLTIETANFEVDARMAQESDLTMGQYVSLSVSDTGTGMTAEVMSRAFDPFFTTKPLGSGTGLGLSMIYGFAKQSGGHVRLYSEVGRGATASIYLPRLVPKTDFLPTRVSAKPTPRSTSGKTVLVVDDEAMVRMLVLDVMEDAGYLSLEAQDGASALEILRSNVQVDLLITDVGMPNMNGRQLADAARALRTDLRVLFITGYAENAVINHGYIESGMQIMTKPFQMDELAAKVKEMIGIPVERTF